MGSAESVPDWRCFEGGSRSRVALWLLREVGVGGTFTKAELRQAFPQAEQIDRRMRELRQEGWRIATYREDRSLSQDELRLVTIGGRVWEKGYASRRTDSVSDTQRSETLALDGYACRLCGIAAGETYPDNTLRTAKLAVERCRNNDELVLRTLCDRCLSGGKKSVPMASAAAIANELVGLDEESRRCVVGWISMDCRGSGPADRIWGRYLSLPASIRQELRNNLSKIATEECVIKADD